MIPFGRPLTDEAERRAVLDVIDSGIFVHGKKTAAFEAAFSAIVSSVTTASVANCTAALHLAHMHFSGGRSGEVICPAQSHVATAHAIELCGLTPVFVDCDPATGNITPEAIEAAITERTIGLTLVHFNGSPCNMPAIMELAGRYGLYVVEDCAIALGARIGGKHVGLFGDAGCFSFHPVKQMTTGEGGMIVSRHDRQRDFELLRAFGVDRQFGERKIPGMYDVLSVGFNYRMAEIPAAMGVQQLAKLAGFQAKRAANYRALAEGLSGIPGIRVLTSDTPDSERAYYSLIFTVDEEAPFTREAIQAHLQAAGMGTSIYYPHPIPRLRYYKDKYGLDLSRFPGAAAIADRSLALPVAPHVTEDDAWLIAGTIKELVVG